MPNSRAEHKGHRVFVMLGLITVLLGSAMVWAVIRFRAYSHILANTHEVVGAISSWEASVTQAESSVRAYFLTGDEDFLREFAAKRVEAEGDDKRLRQLVADDIAETQRVLDLSATLNYISRKQRKQK